MPTEPRTRARLRGPTRWLARVVVTVVVTVSMALAAAFGSPALDAWWLELLRYLPYPIWLLPAVLAFALSLLLGWAWRVAAVLGLAVVAMVIMGLALGHADAGTGRVRVMTYNIKAYLLRPQPEAFAPLELEVARHAPDILVMQDAGELTALRRTMPGAAQSIFVGRQVYAFDQYIVVSRYPLRDCHSGGMAVRGDGGAFVRCTVTADVVEFDLLTAHLLSPRGGLNATRRERAEGLAEWQKNVADRQAQAALVASEVARRTRPIVVAGDLNAPEGSPVVQGLLAHGLRDAFSAAGRGYGYTHGHALQMRSALRGSFLRIDHILVSPELGIAGAFAGGKEASEHRPVIADLLLHRAPD